MENPEKLAVQGTQDEYKQKHKTIMLDTTIRNYRELNWQPITISYQLNVFMINDVYTGQTVMCFDTTLISQ